MILDRSHLRRGPFWKAFRSAADANTPVTILTRAQTVSALTLDIKALVYKAHKAGRLAVLSTISPALIESAQKEQDQSSLIFSLADLVVRLFDKVLRSEYLFVVRTNAHEEIEIDAVTRQASSLD